MCYRLRQEQVKKNLIKVISQDTACNPVQREPCLARLLQNLLVSRWLSNKEGSNRREKINASSSTWLFVFFKLQMFSHSYYVFIEGQLLVRLRGEGNSTPTLPPLVLWSWPWPVFSLAVTRNMPCLEKCHDSKCLSGTVYYNLSKSSESASASR